MITDTEFRPFIVPNLEGKSRRDGVSISDCGTDESMLKNHAIWNCISSWFSKSIKDLIGQDQFDRIYDDDRGEFHLNGVFVSVDWIELEFWEDELPGRHPNSDRATTLTIRFDSLR